MTTGIGGPKKSFFVFFSVLGSGACVIFVTSTATNPHCPVSCRGGWDYVYTEILYTNDRYVGI